MQMKGYSILALSTASTLRCGWSFSLNRPLFDLKEPTRLYDKATSVFDEVNKQTPVFDDVCETTGVTLTRFMHEIERLHPELQELAQLFSGIQTASKVISNLVKRSQLPSSSMLGLEGAINVQGEDQKVRVYFRSTLQLSSVF